MEQMYWPSARGFRASDEWFEEARHHARLLGPIRRTHEIRVVIQMGASEFIEVWVEQFPHPCKSLKGTAILRHMIRKVMARYQLLYGHPSVPGS
jgi:hypothetical protein